MTTAPERKSNADGLEDIHPAARPFLFLGEPKVKRAFFWVPLTGMILSSLLGVFHPQKHPAPWESISGVPIPGSWAIFGFLAYSFIVFAAPFLFKALGRPEDYYGEGGLPDPEISTDPAITGEAHHD
jgi:hypothetical protein